MQNKEKTPKKKEYKRIKKEKYKYSVKHRLIMTKHLKRPLTNKEIVHHIIKQIIE